MKDEIKEILNKLRSDDYYEKEYQKSVYYERDLKKLEDCITNLQEKLKETADLCSKHFVKIQTLKDYKSRNEKAIEYIKGWQSFPHTNGSTHNELRNLLNILNGGDEE